MPDDTLASTVLYCPGCGAELGTMAGPGLEAEDYHNGHECQTEATS